PRRLLFAQDDQVSCASTTLSMSNSHFSSRTGKLRSNQDATFKYLVVTQKAANFRHACAIGSRLDIGPPLLAHEVLPLAGGGSRGPVGPIKGGVGNPVAILPEAPCHYPHDAFVGKHGCQEIARVVARERLIVGIDIKLRNLNGQSEFSE